MDNNSVLESRGTPRPSESVSFDRAVKALGPVCVRPPYCWLLGGQLPYLCTALCA